MSLIKNINRNLSNLPGWQTNRKIIVIESDDWGAIRMPSEEAYWRLKKEGIKACNDDEERYLRNDSLASDNDLIGLFEVLSSVKDKNLNNAVFTAVSVVANPLFSKIKENSYQEYFYEPFIETLKRYPYHNHSFELWKEGFKKQLFIPQFHGREHLNVLNWLKALQIGEKETHIAFENQLYGITPSVPINHVSYQAAFDFDDLSEVEYQKSVIEEGLNLFFQIHGYKSEFFIPTNGPFNNSLEEIAAKAGIKYIGTSKIQAEPIGDGKFKRHFHYLGQKNKFSQRYMTRNCFFEPSSNQKQDWVNDCLDEIAIAFRWHKPAVISSHRVNYIGWLNSINRDRGLFQLRELLKKILITWPYVEFMTSNQLGDLISNKKI